MSVVIAGCYNHRNTPDSFIVDNEYSEAIDTLIKFFFVSPNPIRTNAVVHWEASRSTGINISVRSEDWRLVKTLFDNVVNPGEFVVDFDTSTMPPGAYYVVLTAQTGTHVLPVIIVR